MAKCIICNLKKGKRYCLNKESDICSLCCGTIRNVEMCTGCSYYKAPDLSRKYKDIPRYSTQQMDSDMEIQSYANIIESSLCAFDHSTENKANDSTTIKIYELLLDKYYFKEIYQPNSNEILSKGFEKINTVIESDLSDIPNETIIKILGILHYVAKRRSNGGREYIDFIHNYVGQRIGPGMRVLNKQQMNNIEDIF